MNCDNASVVTFDSEKLDVCASYIRKALSFFASGQCPSCVNSEDEHLADRIDGMAKSKGSFFFLAAFDANITCTPGVWLIYLGVVALKWSDAAIRAHMDDIAIFRESLPRAGGSHQNEMVDSIVDALLTLQSARDKAPPTVTVQTLLTRLLRCARAVEQCGASDQAYDIAAGALYLGPAAGPEVEGLARYASGNAIHAGRYHQVAIAKSVYTVAAAAAAVERLERRAETFDAAEETIEALSMISPPSRRRVLDGFWSTLSAHQYLRSLLIS